MLCGIGPSQEAIEACGDRIVESDADGVSESAVEIAVVGDRRVSRETRPRCKIGIRTTQEA